MIVSWQCQKCGKMNDNNFTGNCRHCGAADEEPKPVKKVKRKIHEPHGTALARQLSTPFLKQLWDSYDGVNTSEEAISGEAVHMVLNERGEGKYCAV